jgi:hypothetical protein
MHPAVQEWLVLQGQYEAYERPALGLKLGAVLVLLLGFFSVLPASLSLALQLALVSVLWLQEGILRTFQARLGARLEYLEQGLGQGSLAETDACQLHTTWRQSRPGTLVLVGEYLRSALRPTVAYPYPVLMALALWLG